MTVVVQPNDPYNVRPWIEDRLKAMEFEQSDMLVNYVLLLIANEKNIGEITVELNELLGEDESAQFCKDLDVELVKGKNKQLKGDGLTAGQKRLLNSALTPAITGKETHNKDGAGPRGRAPDAQSNNRGGNSVLDRLGRSLGGHGGDDSNDAEQPAKRQRGTHGAGAPQMPAQAVNPMFQQMTMMAQAQGYASADEMLVAQQQALMQAMLMGGVGAFGRGGGRGRGGRGGGGWSGGRGPPEFSYDAGGRGRGGRGRGYYDSSEAGGYGGRGGGRGRGAPPPSYGRGRFGAGGRTTDPFGGRGRGRRIFEDDSKTYVRVDMNAGLPSGR